MSPSRPVRASGAALIAGVVFGLAVHTESIKAMDPHAGGATILASLPHCDLVPFEDEASGNTGYRDAAGEVVLPARFGFGEEFDSLGVASVVSGSAWGYIDCQGNFFETLNVDNDADSFREGLVRVRKNGLVGYANLAGEMVIAPRFEEARGFCHGVARIGDHCTSRRVGEITLTDCRKTRYIDTAGRFVPAPANESDAEDCDAMNPAH